MEHKFKPGDLVQLIPTNSTADQGLGGIVGVVTIDPPRQCDHSTTEWAYRVFWLSKREPLRDKCSGTNFIHESAIKLFDPADQGDPK